MIIIRILSHESRSQKIWHPPPEIFGMCAPGYVTNPNPTPTLTPNPNRNPNSNPNQINEKIQKETTLEIDQITKCQFGRWKLVKTI